MRASPSLLLSFYTFAMVRPEIDLSLPSSKADTLSKGGVNSNELYLSFSVSYFQEYCAKPCQTFYCHMTLRIGVK